MKKHLLKPFVWVLPIVVFASTLAFAEPKDPLFDPHAGETPKQKADRDNIEHKMGRDMPDVKNNAGMDISKGVEVSHDTTLSAGKIDSASPKKDQVSRPGTSEPKAFGLKAEAKFDGPKGGGESKGLGGSSNAGGSSGSGGASRSAQHDKH